MTHRLGIGEAEELCEWFLHWLPMDLRSKLITERPLLYAAAFPEVEHDVILKHVQDGLRRQAEVRDAEERERF